MISYLDLFPILKNEYTQEELKRFLNATPDELLGLLLRHKILPQVFQNLKSEIVFQNHSSFEIIKTQSKKMMAISLLFSNTLKDIVATAQRNNIPILIMKGAAWSQLLYDSPIARKTGDIDLLISIKDRSKFLELMRSKGFDSFMSKMVGRVRSRYLLNEISFHKKHPLKKITLDIHTQFTQRAYVKNHPFSQYYKDSIELDILGTKMRTLSPEWTFVFMVIHHGLIDHWGYSRHLLDLEKFIEKFEKELNWEKVKQLLEQFDLTLPAQMGLQLLKKYDFKYGKLNLYEEVEDLTHLCSIDLKNKKSRKIHLRDCLKLREHNSIKIRNVILSFISSIVPNTSDYIFFPYLHHPLFYPLYFPLKLVRILVKGSNSRLDY